MNPRFFSTDAVSKLVTRVLEDFPCQSLRHNHVNDLAVYDFTRIRLLAQNLKHVEWLFIIREVFQIVNHLNHLLIGILLRTATEWLLNMPLWVPHKFCSNRINNIPLNSLSEEISDFTFRPPQTVSFDKLFNNIIPRVHKLSLNVCASERVCFDDAIFIFKLVVNNFFQFYLVHLRDTPWLN